MVDTIVWQAQVSQEAMADGELTLYSDKIPPGYIGCARIISARGNVGGANENIILGIEVNGVKHKLKYGYTDAADEIVRLIGLVRLKENDRVFAEFEAANNSEILYLTVNGCYEKV